MICLEVYFWITQKNEFLFTKVIRLLLFSYLILLVPVKIVHRKLTHTSVFST